MDWRTDWFWFRCGRDVMRGFDRWHILLVWQPGPNPPGFMASGTHIELTWRWQRPRLTLQRVPAILADRKDR